MPSALTTPPPVENVEKTCPPNALANCSRGFSVGRILGTRPASSRNGRISVASNILLTTRHTLGVFCTTWTPWTEWYRTYSFLDSTYTIPRYPESSITMPFKALASSSTRLMDSLYLLSNWYSTFLLVGEDFGWISFWYNSSSSSSLKLTGVPGPWPCVWQPYLVQQLPSCRPYVWP
jgi:hypothetical protein